MYGFIYGNILAEVEENVSKSTHSKTTKSLSKYSDVLLSSIKLHLQYDYRFYPTIYYAESFKSAWSTPKSLEPFRRWVIDKDYSVIGFDVSYFIRIIPIVYYAKSERTLRRRLDICYSHTNDPNPISLQAESFALALYLALKHTHPSLIKQRLIHTYKLDFNKEYNPKLLEDWFMFVFDAFFKSHSYKHALSLISTTTPTNSLNYGLVASLAEAYYGSTRLIQKMVNQHLHVSDVKLLDELYLKVRPTPLNIPLDVISVMGPNVQVIQAIREHNSRFDYMEDDEYALHESY